jgi:hypothetical protein
MESRTKEEIAKIARFAEVQDGDAKEPRWLIRRRRLQRLADLIDAHKEPLQLFLAMEWVPKKERPALRQDGSPLAIAYGDPLFRIEGLRGDSVGDAMAFFQLSLRQVHAMFCECGYSHSLEQDTAKLVAQRVRSFAKRRSVAELFSKLKIMVEPWWRTNETTGR